MQLYKARWNNELDLRVIKETLQMNVLCCETPELIRKEIWAHIIMHRVGDRPDRFEPRLRKRRDGAYDLLTKPRHIAKSEIQQRLMH